MALMVGSGKVDVAYKLMNPSLKLECSRDMPTGAFTMVILIEAASSMM
jgi:hypothetical protein